MKGIVPNWTDGSILFRETWWYKQPTRIGGKNSLPLSFCRHTHSTVVLLGANQPLVIFNGVISSTR